MPRNYVFETKQNKKKCVKHDLIEISIEHRIGLEMKNMLYLKIKTAICECDKIRWHQTLICGKLFSQWQLPSTHTRNNSHIIRSFNIESVSAVVIKTTTRKTMCMWTFQTGFMQISSKQNPFNSTIWLPVLCRNHFHQFFLHYTKTVFRKLTVFRLKFETMHCN